MSVVLRGVRGWGGVVSRCITVSFFVSSEAAVWLPSQNIQGEKFFSSLLSPSSSLMPLYGRNTVLTTGQTHLDRVVHTYVTHMRHGISGKSSIKQ